jgi:hypothetical protein
MCCFLSLADESPKLKSSANRCPLALAAQKSREWRQVRRRRRQAWRGACARALASPRTCKNFIFHRNLAIIVFNTASSKCFAIQAQQQHASRFIATLQHTRPPAPGRLRRASRLKIKLQTTSLFSFGSNNAEDVRPLVHPSFHRTTKKR